jgi:uncharacterized protein YbaP (TraB family)
MRFASTWTALCRSIVAAAATAVALGGAWGARAEPPIWRVHGAHSEVVLFGSVHLLTPGLDWRTPAVEAALAQADTLWFEIPIDAGTDAAAAKAMQGRMRLPQGGSLAALLSPMARARLARVAPSLGVTAAAVDGYRPWYAEIVLTLLDLRRHGADQGDGVETSLAREAPPTAMRRAFETADEQVGFLADAPIREQVASLEETLRQIEEEPDDFAKLQQAWLAGDADWIEREGVEPMRRATPMIYRRLVTARNRRWADQIERLLKTPDRAFIVVGVGHLVGPDSVPALLRRRGLKVEGP